MWTCQGKGEGGGHLLIEILSVRGPSVGKGGVTSFGKLKNIKRLDSE